MSRIEQCHSRNGDSYRCVLPADHDDDHTALSFNGRPISWNDNPPEED